MKKSCILLFLFVYSFSTAQTKIDKKDAIIGVKIYEQQADYGPLFREWKILGINTAYVSVTLAYDQQFRTMAKENQVDVYIIFPVFFNSEALKNHPEWYAITQEGSIAKEEWVEFVNPSNEAYRVQCTSLIEKVVRETKPVGVSIDFIRYFAYWEKIYEGRTLESIPDSSFDTISLAAFQADKEIRIPQILLSVQEKSTWILQKHAEDWIEWKCDNIVSMVKNIVTTVKAIQPGIRTNLHAVPWRKNDFGGAIKRIVGQDLTRLSKLVDYVSPMCYSHMLKRDAEWVSSVIKEFKGQIGDTHILPSIQVAKAYLEEPFGDEEFECVVKAALESPSKGVVFWSWPHLDKDPSKKEIVKRLAN